MTVRDCLASARARLQASGLAAADAALDARVLVQHVVARDPAWLLAHGDHEPTPAQVAHLDACVARRARHEPIAYITGVREFFGREFHVTPAVFIPRPETELIVEAMLEACPAPGTRMSIVDVGTGSGCIAVSIACERPAAHVTAIDISAAALEIARGNATRHGVANRLTFVEHSLIPAGLSGLDAVVSNPPYVSLDDRDGLAPTVRDFEPHAALFAGPTGLDLIGPLLEQAAGALRPGGILVMEIGAGQAGAVMRIATAAGFADVAMRRDLAGIERTLVARR